MTETATKVVQPVREDHTVKREAALAALIDRWTAHMRWRADYADWREHRLWPECHQEGRLRQLDRI